ncbi:hypothetical protein TNCV_4743551 [Trichonephila clavipes]|nr:hypothetical protein TNCV_4743551 [Trichonephila clavipes]
MCDTAKDAIRVLEALVQINFKIPFLRPYLRSLKVLLFLMPPVGRSQIDAHEIHRGKELERSLSVPPAGSLSTFLTPGSPRLSLSALLRLLSLGLSERRIFHCLYWGYPLQTHCRLGWVGSGRPTQAGSRSSSGH